MSLSHPPRLTRFPYTTLFRSKRPGKAALAALLAWDGDYATTDEAGTVDPGVAIWEEFKDRVEAIMLRPMGEAEAARSEEHTSELQSPCNLVCRLLLEKKKKSA